MQQGVDDLSEKEKEALRLIVSGHDAKSAARALELSVHTINERLRCARRKLDVTSSREAGRLMMASEDKASADGKENAARNWLALVDRNDLIAAYEQASAAFRQALPQGPFADSMRSARGPLGEVVSRKVSQIGAINDGANDYVLVLFDTDFENRSSAVERVVLEREADRLTVSGYWIQ